MTAESIPATPQPASASPAEGAPPPAETTKPARRSTTREQAARLDAQTLAAKAQRLAAGAAEATPPVSAVVDPAQPPEPVPAAEPPKQSDSALKLLRAQRALDEANQRALESDQRFKDLDGKHKELTQLMESLRGDKGKLLEHFGVDLRALIQESAEGKLNPKTPEQLELERIRADFDKLTREREAERKAAEERETMQRAESERAERVQMLSQELKEAASTFPVLAHLEHGAQSLLDFAERSGIEDLAEAAAQLNEKGMNNVRTLLGSEHVIDALLSDPDIKQRLAAKLGAQPQVSEAGQPGERGHESSTPMLGSPTITNSHATETTAPPAAKRSLSPQERRRNAMAAADRWANKLTMPNA